MLATHLGGTFIPLSPARGVARVVVPAAGQTPLTVDISGYTGTIEEDLARRDFTINAFAAPLTQWISGPGPEHILDPFNGIEDLARKRVKAVSPQVFRDDPGRLLRAVRLASRLRFLLDPETAQLIRTDAPGIARVSPERLRDELLAILAGDGARGQLEVLDRLDLLCRIIPELASTKGVDQPNAHYWDVWGHLLHTVEYAERITQGHQNSPVYTVVPWTSESDEHFSQEVSDGHTRRTILKLAALFHDIAKPQTKAQDETGRTRFLGHSEMGAEMAAARLTQLRLSSRGIDMVAKMVEQHLRPGNMRQGVEWPTNRAIYRYFRDLGDVAVDTLYLAMADYLAAKGPELDSDDWNTHVRMIGHILHSGTQQSPPDKPDRLVTGLDLMQELNLLPGPLIGDLLEKISESRAVGEITTREEALSLATGILRSQRQQE